MTIEELAQKEYELLKACVQAYDAKDYHNPVHEEHSQFYKEHKVALDKHMLEVVKPNIQSKLKLLFIKKALDKSIG